MRVLVGCEESGVVRYEFERMGWDAWSCDLIPTRDPENKKHIQADILTVLDDDWDMAIFFTPCTFLANSGSKHLYIDGRKENGMYLPRWELMRRDAELFKACMNSRIPKVVNENPIPHKYALKIIGRKYDQIIQPWQFGHPESKQTCLWVRGLPLLKPTNDVREEMLKLPKKQAQRIHHMPPSATRQRDRSETLLGIAKAMAEQWGNLTID